MVESCAWARPTGAATSVTRSPDATKSARNPLRPAANRRGRCEMLGTCFMLANFGASGALAASAVPCPLDPLETKLPAHPLELFLLPGTQKLAIYPLCEVVQHEGRRRSAIRVGREGQLGGGRLNALSLIVF